MKRRHLAIAAAVASGLAAPAVVFGHGLDHPVPPTFSPINEPLSTNFNSGGEGAKWELQNSIPTLNPHSDLDFFTQGKDTYASVGVLASSTLNGGGQTIVKLTQDGEVTDKPGEVVTSHPSAACASATSSATGLQHDVEATPKSNVILNTNVPDAARQDAQLLLDASDAAGRCHDNGEFGVAGAGRGGLEIIDITKLQAGERPKEIALTSHIGESHTVNVDPRRPHIAYSVTSDSVGVDANGVRANEAEGSTSNALDGWEVVNLRSCLEAPLGTIPPGTPVEEKRNLCKPQVYRYRYPSIDIALGHTNRGSIYGCHELEVYPDDRLTCGGGAAMILFDIKGMFNDMGTPNNFLDDEINSVDGKPLPCRLRESTSLTEPNGFTTALITDCVKGGTDEEQIDLRVRNWLDIGTPGAITGVKHLGSVFHQGRETSTGALDPAYPSTEDIDFDHEAEFTESRKFILATDERGGGVTAGAQCVPEVEPGFSNGGLHAYAVDRLQMKTPAGDTPEARAAEAHKAYALNSDGKKAIYRESNLPNASFCTAHVFQQIPGQNRIFMGWYSQGTRVVDFTENADGTVDFKEAGYFIPEGANEWVSAIYRMQQNADGSFTYYGATGDGVVGDAGRNGIDLYKVTLPPPPKPGPGANPPKDPPNTGNNNQQPNNQNQGNPPNNNTTPNPPACQSRLGFLSASARGATKGGGVRFDFRRRATTNEPVTVDIFQQSRGRKVTGERLVRRFTNRKGAFTWNGRDRRGRKMTNGYYFARFRIKVNGVTDTVRITLGRSDGKFGPRRSFYRRDSCGALRSFKLSRPVFGGRDNRALGIAYRLNAPGRVQVTVTDRRERVIRRFAAKDVAAGRSQRLSLPARRLARGDYRVKISVTAGGRTSTAVLTSRRI